MRRSVATDRHKNICYANENKGWHRSPDSLDCIAVIATFCNSGKRLASRHTICYHSAYMKETVTIQKSPEQEEAELNPKVEAKYNEFVQMPYVREALDIWDEIEKEKGVYPYHNKVHTEDVIRETILFALADGATEEVIIQQVIAAAWHDVGFWVQKSKNEPIGVKMFEASDAIEHMPPRAVEETKNNISATALIPKQGTIGILHQARGQSTVFYILDADVSNFGRGDFFDKHKLVAKEMDIDLSKPEEKKKYYEFTIKLLENHEWKEKSAERLRGPKMKKNLEKLMAEYDKMAA